MTETLAQEVSAAFTTLGTDLVDVVKAIAPIGISVFAVYLAFRYGKRILTMFTGR